MFKEIDIEDACNTKNLLGKLKDKTDNFEKSGINGTKCNACNEKHCGKCRRAIKTLYCEKLKHRK